MKKIICILNFILLLLCSLFNLPHFENASAKSGNYVYVDAPTEVEVGSSYMASIYASSLFNISTLSLDVYFDSSVVTINNTFNQLSCSMYDSYEGDEKIRYTYLLNETSSEEQQLLFTFSYSVNINTTAKTSYFDVVVDESYDVNLDISELSGSILYFDINTIEDFNSVDVYGISSIATRKNSIIELSYRFSSQNIAAGSILISYDRDYLEYVDIKLNKFFDNKTYDINVSASGSISITFAGIEISSSTEICSIKLKSITNEEIRSEVCFTATELFDIDLNRLYSYAFTTSISNIYLKDYDDSIPSLIYIPSFDPSTKKLDITLKLTENSNLGAGDFEIAYNSSYLTFLDYEKKFNPSFFNVNFKKEPNNNIKFIKFSIISIDGIVDEVDIINLSFSVSNFYHDDFDVFFSLVGTGITDNLTNPISLNLVNTNIVIPGRCWNNDQDGWGILPSTCTEDGYQSRECYICGNVETRIIPATGHHFSEEWTIDIPATCQHDGLKSHHCRDCEEKCDETVIPKLEHRQGNPVIENRTQASCLLDGGYDNVIYCLDCGEEISRTHVSIVKTGHKPSEIIKENVVDSTCTSKGGYDNVVYCTTCGEVLSYEHIETDYGEHYITNYYVSKNPTFYSEGIESGLCLICFQDVTRNIPSHYDSDLAPIIDGLGFHSDNDISWNGMNYRGDGTDCSDSFFQIRSMVLSLSNEKLRLFINSDDTIISEARNRYEEWARILKENPYSFNNRSSGDTTFIYSRNDFSTISIVIACLSIIGVASVIYIRRRRDYK